MWYVVLITLVIDVGGLLLVYAVLRDRVRRATSAATQIAELRDEVSRLVVELNQTTERNVALLEDRITGLNDVLAAADRKVALLQRETEKHDVGAKVYSRLVEGGARAAQGDTNRAQGGANRAQGSASSAQGSASSAQGSASSAQGCASSAQGGASSAQGNASSAQGSASSAQADASSGKSEPAAAARSRTSLSVELSDNTGQRRNVAGPAGGLGKGVPASDRQDLRERVVMLSQSGFSASLIAARVGMPLGEVELIISLERQRMSQPAPRSDEEQV